MSDRRTGRPALAHVRLQPLTVSGGRLSVTWEIDPPSRYQRRCAWYLELHDLDLGLLDRRVLMDVVLALQLRVWAGEARSVVVHLPEPVGRVTLDFWRAYLDAGHVEFCGPVDDVSRYASPPGTRPQSTGRLGRLGRLLEPGLARRGPPRAHRVAVTYGGGKDSTLAYRTLVENRSPQDVVAVHLTQLFALGREAREEGLARSREVILRGLRDLGDGAVVQTGATNLLATYHRGRFVPRPHVLLYTAGILPALLAHDVDDVVFSRTGVGYRVTHGPDGPTYANPTGRPEKLAHLRRYLRHVTGRDIGAESTHYALSELVSFRTLLHAYPDAFASMVMCAATRERRRFCQSCTKCLEYVVFALAEGHVAPDLDHGALFASDPVRAVLARARGDRGVRGAHGSGPWHRDLGSASHFAAWCHSLSRLDPHDPGLGIPDAVRDDLAVLARHWGHPFPAAATLEEGAVRGAGPLGAEVARVAARHHRVEDEPDRTVLVGEEAVGFDHRTPMPTPALDAWARAHEVPALTDTDERGVRRDPTRRASVRTRRPRAGV